MQKALKDSILFSGIDAEELKLVEETGVKIKAAKGTFLFFQGDPGKKFYLVLSGKIKVHKNSPDGKEQILLMASPGDTFGEAALFARKNYPANAEAIEDSTLMSFSRDKFLKLINEHPALAINMIARLSSLLHHLSRLVQQLSLEDISTRLAGYLLEFMPDYKPGEKPKITLAEKKMTLASILGTIPETLSRAFAKLTKIKVIEVSGQEITVNDPAQLEEIAAGKKF
ncbi:MAG: Crp/Fnr family transcriptional regulator [candidate division Zixibacteria bacterium]